MNPETNLYKTFCDVISKSGRKCWGYEEQLGFACPPNAITKMPGKDLLGVANLSQKLAVCINCPFIDCFQTECFADANGWARTRKAQSELFYSQGDFGYIQQQLSEIKPYCLPNENRDPESVYSKLECTDQFRFCRAENIMIDFSKLSHLPEPVKYRTDVLDDGLIGGWNCKLDKASMRDQGKHKSPLQSWYEELEHYTVFNDKVECEVNLEKPTFIMKLDATVNMYHHFCDFVNLYASLHINNTFQMDNTILIWDTYPYRSNFEPVWSAFSGHPPLSLKAFTGKKVCFRQAVFPLLPRMVFGLYYNMPLVPGCYKSGLFNAFNRHVLHKLGISSRFDPKKDKKQVRITLISRTTQYRRILNERALVEALKKKSSSFAVRVATFSHSQPFKDQLDLIANTDILIGMHGAGLTHCLFLPDWAVLFELYNCDDVHCYKDLAHLRGVKYITWENKEKLERDSGRTGVNGDENNAKNGAHLKFSNYRFDVQEFLRLTMVAVQHVRTARYRHFESKQSEEPAVIRGLHSEHIEL